MRQLSWVEIVLEAKKSKKVDKLSLIREYRYIIHSCINQSSFHVTKIMPTIEIKNSWKSKDNLQNENLSNR